MFFFDVQIGYQIYYKMQLIFTPHITYIISCTPHTQWNNLTKCFFFSFWLSPLFFFFFKYFYSKSKLFYVCLFVCFVFKYCDSVHQHTVMGMCFNLPMLFSSCWYVVIGRRQPPLKLRLPHHGQPVEPEEWLVYRLSCWLCQTPVPISQRQWVQCSG